MTAYSILLDLARPDLHPMQNTAQTGRLRVGSTLSGLKFNPTRGVQFHHERGGLGHWVTSGNLDVKTPTDIPAFFCSLNAEPSPQVCQQLFDVYRSRFSSDRMMVRQFVVSRQKDVLCGYLACVYATDLVVFKKTYADVAQATYDLDALPGYLINVLEKGHPIVEEPPRLRGRHRRLVVRDLTIKRPYSAPRTIPSTSTTSPYTSSGRSSCSSVTSTSSSRSPKSTNRSIASSTQNPKKKKKKRKLQQVQLPISMRPKKRTRRGDLGI
jgi:hypothetical protein